MTTINAQQILQDMKTAKYTCIASVKINNHDNPSRLSEIFTDQTYEQIIPLIRVEALLRDSGVDTTFAVLAEGTWNRVELITEDTWMYLEIAAEDLPTPESFISIEVN